MATVWCEQPNAGIQPEGGDTLLTLGEGRCSTSQVLPSTSGEL